MWIDVIQECINRILFFFYSNLILNYPWQNFFTLQSPTSLVWACAYESIDHRSLHSGSIEFGSFKVIYGMPFPFFFRWFFFVISCNTNLFVGQMKFPFAHILFDLLIFESERINPIFVHRIPILIYTNWRTISISLIC